MDTTGLFRHGQQYELRIGLPKEKLRGSNNGSGSQGTTSTSSSGGHRIPSSILQSAALLRRSAASSRRDSHSSSATSNSSSSRRDSGGSSSSSRREFLPTRPTRENLYNNDYYSRSCPGNSNRENDLCLNSNFSRSCPSRSNTLRRSNSSTRDIIDFIFPDNKSSSSSRDYLLTTCNNESTSSSSNRVTRDNGNKVHLSRRDGNNQVAPKPLPRSITPAGRINNTKTGSPKPAPRLSKEGRRRHNSMIIKSKKLKPFVSQVRTR